MMKMFLRITRYFLLGAICLILVTGSIWLPASQLERVHLFTRPFEFDYIKWTVNAIVQKLHTSSLGIVGNLSESQKRAILYDYFQLQNEVDQMTLVIENLLSDPARSTDGEELERLRTGLSQKEKLLWEKSILAESVTQDYVSQALNDLGLASIRQPFPPVLYHVTDLPKNLVISPREVIRQEKNVSLKPEISPFEVARLEDQVEKNSDYSSLVVQVGGISTYPAMVISTTSLPFLLDTVAHEWIHHFLVFRPLGIRYSFSPQLRTMNETAASIAGQEISDYIIRKFFFDLISPPLPYETLEVSHTYPSRSESGEFDFHQQMHMTRLRVDELLSEKKVDEAEAYMEERRTIFWENGYQIRRLNQAYFAFHGAYANKPFSAAGADPVGEDVRALRARSRDLAHFIHTISGMSSYDTLRDLIRAY